MHQNYNIRGCRRQTLVKKRRGAFYFYIAFASCQFFFMKRLFPVSAALLFFLWSFHATAAFGQSPVSAADTLHYPEETHFRNVQQLTFGGDNAEAYWSFDGKRIVFQRTSAKDGIPCDQIFYGELPKPGEAFTYKRISTGKGRTTCAFFTKDNEHVIYASTHESDEACPPLPDRSKYGNRYIWPVYSSYDIYMADLDGKIVKKLTTTPGYDAEATLSPDGEKMLFTSLRNGDLDLYAMELKSGRVKQITNTLGYDGGAWFSPDGKKIVWRASRPKTEAEVKEYKDLLKDGLVAPTQMEVFIANADGSGVKQITSLGQANWAPNFLPDGNVIFLQQPCLQTRLPVQHVHPESGWNGNGKN